MNYEDDDEERDEILKGLSGEVDEFAGSQLKDPNGKTGSVTITITTGPGAKIEKEMEGEEESDGEHDPVAHILGMCRGGCPGE